MCPLAYVNVQQRVVAAVYCSTVDVLLSYVSEHNGFTDLNSTTVYHALVLCTLTVCSGIFTHLLRALAVDNSLSVLLMHCKYDSTAKSETEHNATKTRQCSRQR